MTKEQEEIIQRVNSDIDSPLSGGYTTIVLTDDLEEILNTLKEKDAEIEKKDNAVKRIINRLDNDIKRITESKTEKYCDDYRRCRLKAYRTKTREIKKYIKKQYFERKVENE